MAERITCCIPFCKRTKAKEKINPEHNEWICQKHWPLVSKSLKTKHRKAEKIFSKKRTKASFELASHIWEKCKDEAFQKSVGI